MANITYRAATVDDIEMLAELRWEMEVERAEGHLPTREEFIVAYLDETRDDLARGIHRAWLAEADGVPVACVQLIWWVMPPNVHRLRRKRGFVSNVYTRPAYRRRGIARELMNQLIQHSRDLGIQRLVLWSSEMGRPLYADLGFIPCRGLEHNLD
jgi:GNAT superfamily N-acetyltransferase